MLTHDRLLELLSYDPERGLLCWKAPRRGVGQGRAGTLDTSTGYRRIRIDGKVYAEHAIARFYVEGVMPKPHTTDHLNWQRDDNRYANLRHVTRSQNQRNMRPRQRSLPKGVAPNHKRFMANITINYRHTYLGTFDTPDEASAAYQAALIEHR
jgi:hypothetical protein